MEAPCWIMGGKPSGLIAVPPAYPHELPEGGNPTSDSVENTRYRAFEGGVTHCIGIERFVGVASGKYPAILKAVI
jgi:hypothetical protein